MLLVDISAAAEIEDLEKFSKASNDDLDGIIGDDEAAEILEAMLGLAPAVLAAERPKKKRKTSNKV